MEHKAEANRYFFISYTSSDRAWAEWIAATLEGAGYTTVLQATIMAKRIVAVLSPAYFASQFAESEWRTAFAALLHLAKGAAGG